MKRGNGKGGSSRPVSWCVGGCPVSESKYFVNSCNENDEDDKENLQEEEEEEEDGCVSSSRRESTLARGILVRSTSYQALHSALARLYRLDDFTLERIGQGFFSEVYKARHIVTGKIMVLKMNKLFSNRHNMVREVELMNRLHHPNILNYYGVCIHEGQVHALTQYINGGSLDVLLQNIRIDLSWSTRASLALDMAKGMSYLHSKKVFHRDLTSKNVLIKQSKEIGKYRLRAVIADFGLAAPIPQDKSVRLRQVGSPYWMAPEVIRGEWYDHRVDIFSYGIIVCEIIARCDADPDVLPRTHNFGVHYLAFSHMCQSDCPPSLLEMAFQCCQIDPDSRPSFKELEALLCYFIADSRPALSPRKQKAYHRRSLSDDSYMLVRTPSAEGTPKEAPSPSPNAGSPQEVLERMSAADPYFQPSSATVNPFSSVKLPARLQLILQDGGRCCHSLPADLRNCHLCSAPSVGPGHLATSASSLSQCGVVSPLRDGSWGCCGGCPSPPASSETSPSCSHCDSHCKSNNSLCKKKHVRSTEPGCKCGAHSRGTDSPRGPVNRTAAVISTASMRLCTGGATCCQDPFQMSGTSPRSDTGGGGGGGLLNPPPPGIGGVAIRRRGSGESGFFSVEDELCLSYSELSSASFVSTEDDETFGVGAHPILHRSPSVVTDSSEDLSCDPSPFQGPHLSPSDRGDHSALMASAPAPTDGAGGSTDIKSIVEFFERGYGALRAMSEAERARQLAAATARRKECLVPFLRSRFSTTAGGCFSQRAALVGSHGLTKHLPHNGGNGCCSIAQGSSSKSVCAKDKCRSTCGRNHACDRREGAALLRGRECGRPKVYITAGTVRAKRNIFESK